MKPTIIACKEDLGSMNIYSRLLESFDFKETPREYHSHPFLESKKTGLQLLLIDSLHIHASHLDELKAEFIVFASRHSSKSGKPSLTVHPVGNWGKAELGGKNRSLVKTSSALMKNYLLGLKKQKEQKKLEKFAVSYEVTHHGPFLNTPCCFIEIGSTEKQWKNEKAAMAIAETIMNCTEFPECKTAIGIGGLHYNPYFTKISLLSKYAFSHMCPKYALQHFDQEMLRKALNASIEKVEEIIVEKKGLGQEKQRILSLLENQGIPVKRAKRIKKKARKKAKEKQ